MPVRRGHEVIAPDWLRYMILISTAQISLYRTSNITSSMLIGRSVC